MTADAGQHPNKRPASGVGVNEMPRKPRTEKNPATQPTAQQPTPTCVADDVSSHRELLVAEHGPIGRCPDCGDQVDALAWMRSRVERGLVS